MHEEDGHVTDAATTGSHVTYPKVVAGLRDNGVSLADISRATQVKVRQVQHWLAGTSKPQGFTLERLVDLNYLIERLADVYVPEGIEIWLHGRNRALGGQRPIDVLESGDFESVIDLVEQLTHGIQG